MISANCCYTSSGITLQLYQCYSSGITPQEVFESERDGLYSRVLEGVGMAEDYKGEGAGSQ